MDKLVHAFVQLFEGYVDLVDDLVGLWGRRLIFDQLESVGDSLDKRKEGVAGPEKTFEYPFGIAVKRVVCRLCRAPRKSRERRNREYERLHFQTPKKTHTTNKQN